MKSSIAIYEMLLMFIITGTIAFFAIEGLYTVIKWVIGFGL